MAIVLMLPLGLLAIAIAVLRLTLGSLHAHRAEQAAAVERSRPAERSGAAVAERLALTVDCQFAEMTRTAARPRNWLTRFTATGGVPTGYLPPPTSSSRPAR